MSMLRPVPMVHFRAQVPNRDAAVATRAIAGEGLLHLVDIAHGRTPYDASPPGVRELYASFRDLVNRIRSTVERIGINQRELTGSVDGDDIIDFAVERDRILLAFEPIEQRITDLARNASAARDSVATIRDSVAQAERIRRADLAIDRLFPLRFAAMRLGIAPPDSLQSMAGVFAPLSHAIIPLDDDGTNVLFAAITTVTARARLDEAMRLAVAQPVSLPKSAQDLDPQVLNRELQQAESASVDAQRAIDEERESSRESLLKLARRSETAMLLLQAQTFFAAAGRFIVISGWVPQESAPRLRDRVLSATKNRAIVEIEAAEQVPGFAEGTLRVPILHHNPLLLRPFQKLVEIYGTPSYNEVEPTAFFAVAFLLMFGLMFGDVGHGAVLFSAGWFLYRYLPRFLDYGILLMEAGTASATFGVLYGSVFGVRGLIPALWLEPIEDLPKFMVIAVVFGAVVVSVGLILNIMNTWRTGDLKAALIGPKGLTGALLYWIILVVLARAFVSTSVRIPSAIIIALVVAVILLLAIARPLVHAIEKRAPPRPRPAVRTTPWFLHALESSVELVDTLFSFFANTISFVRIAAFAAVHAAVLLAIFALVDTISGSRFAGVLAVVIQIAGNALVILLEGLIVSVQVLRLEYYEFFGKFFRSGGERYAP
ncbi:MAG TPA: V-type ATPase 116kDa subunit family protein, partial [Thermoanaerobaculia bacterium]|nr:V-type ATPase 116kDa subunit family protein [Thermoanaerobaculia bacterium]